jgi:hypothetical protein
MGVCMHASPVLSSNPSKTLRRDVHARPLDSPSIRGNRPTEGRWGCGDGTRDERVRGKMRIWRRALNDSKTHHDRRQSRLSFRRCNAMRERHTQKSETERMQSTRMNINAAAEWGESGTSDDKQRDGGDVRHYTGKRRYRRRTLTVERDRLKKQSMCPFSLFPG